MKKIGKESNGSELFTVIEPGMPSNQLSEMEKSLILGGDCGAEGCKGDAGCAVQTCGGQACGGAACGVVVCPLDACIGNLCPINICPVDVCVVDVCIPADFFLADNGSDSESGSDSYSGGYSDDFGFSMA